MPHYLRLFMQQDRCRCRCCRRVRWRGRGHVLCMHDGSQKAPQSAHCCLCPAVCNIMLHQAHGAAACNNKKIDDDEAAAAEQRKLELLCASQLNDTLEGGEEEWGSSFRYSPSPLTPFVGLSSQLVSGVPAFFSCCLFYLL